MACKGCGKRALPVTRMAMMEAHPPKIHTTFITYNRLELTKQAIASYIENTSWPYTLSVVDNASSDGTQEWLVSEQQAGRIHDVILLDENMYPGYACNRGWELAPEDAVILHRADNDFVFLPNWCDEIAWAFGHIRRLGQLGLRSREVEKSKVNVGGNCLIPKPLWDRGLRWDERPWPQLAEEVGPGWTEDSLLSQRIQQLGFKWGRARASVVEPISQDDPDDDYYKQTWRDRKML